MENKNKMKYFLTLIAACICIVLGYSISAIEYKSDRNVRKSVQNSTNLAKMNDEIFNFPEELAPELYWTLDTIQLNSYYDRKSNRIILEFAEEN
jgi:hypothetical protein